VTKLDRFPEAFRRFEQDVDIRNVKSVRELAYEFAWWAGKRWRDSYLQNLALKREARKHGIEGEIPAYHRREVQQRFQRTTWRQESVTVKGKPQTRYRDLETGRFTKKP
jgi:hypothetical protein